MASAEDVDRRSDMGEKYFFDLGSTYYDAGLGGASDSFKWFKETYEARGVVFDHVYAWEPKNLPGYWSHVPDDMYLKLHFYNMFATADLGAMSNPLTHVLKRCKKEDFVVVKVVFMNSLSCLRSFTLDYSLHDVSI